MLLFEYMINIKDNRLESVSLFISCLLVFVWDDIVAIKGHDIVPKVLTFIPEPLRVVL